MVSFEKVDIVVKEVKAPPDGWCDNNHQPPKTFRRGGKDSPAEPTKFFTVTRTGMGCVGTFCEPCLIVANYANHLKRKKAESLGEQDGRADPLFAEVEQS